MKGGAWLGTHLANPLTRKKIEEGNWDKVVLQEHYLSAKPERRQEFLTAATALRDIVVDCSAMPILYASPTIEAEGRAGFAVLHSVNLEVARRLHVTLAPAGTACLRAWEKLPELDLHNPDRAHPNFKAAYIGTCALYAALTGLSPIGLPGQCGKGAVSDDEALVFQTAAWGAYRETNDGQDRRAA